MRRLVRLFRFRVGFRVEWLARLACLVRCPHGVMAEMQDHRVVLLDCRMHFVIGWAPAFPIASSDLMDRRTVVLGSCAREQHLTAC